MAFTKSSGYANLPNGKLTYQTVTLAQLSTAKKSKSFSELHQ
jgi:hypothetical protein